MSRSTWALSAVAVVLVVSAAIGGIVWRRHAAANGQIVSGRAEVQRLERAGRYGEAADTLEVIQMRLMAAGRYQEELDAAFAIEALSVKASARRSPWNYVRIAEVYLRLGERDQFFHWMEKAVNERGFSKVAYFESAEVASLKSDPRFAPLAEACANQVGIGKKARDFQVTLLDGSTFSLSAQAGKVVLIDFWDVMCPPCRREMPNLKQMAADFGGRGLEIVGISLDTDRRLLMDFVQKEQLPWKIACSFTGWNDTTAALYRIIATPSTWVIDRRGVVRFHDLRGPELRRAVDELLRESS